MTHHQFIKLYIRQTSQYVKQAGKLIPGKVRTCDPNDNSIKPELQYKKEAALKKVTKDKTTEENEESKPQRLSHPGDLSSRARLTRSGDGHWGKKGQPTKIT